MQYTTEHNSKGSFRFNIQNPPPAGTELKTKRGEAVVFDEVGLAGMHAQERRLAAALLSARSRYSKWRWRDE